MSQTTTRVDPWRSFNFRVEIDGTTVAAFSEITGLTAEGDAVDYRTGADPNNSVRKLIGLRKYSALTLKNGMTTDLTLVNMYTLTANGDPKARRSGTVVLQDETHKDVMFFHFVNGFVNKMELPHLTASGNEVALQSVEIVHEGLTVQLAK
jgi:phage tail-like protein